MNQNKRNFSSTQKRTYLISALTMARPETDRFVVIVRLGSGVHTLSGAQVVDLLHIDNTNYYCHDHHARGRAQDKGRQWDVRRRRQGNVDPWSNDYLLVCLGQRQTMRLVVLAAALYCGVVQTLTEPSSRQSKELIFFFHMGGIKGTRNYIANKYNLQWWENSDEKYTEKAQINLETWERSMTKSNVTE